MSAHRPTGRIEVDVFDLTQESPEAAATALWETVVRWVREDVKPIIVVTMEDDTTYSVDLAGARSVCRFCQHDIWHSDSDGWVAPDAGIDRESGDGIWRDSCPDNDTEPGAPHVPEEGS